MRSEAEIWADFAAAIAVEDSIRASYVAERADKLLEEFKKRYRRETDNLGYGVWVPTRKKET